MAYCIVFHGLPDIFPGIAPLVACAYSDGCPYSFLGTGAYQEQTGKGWPPFSRSDLGSSPGLYHQYGTDINKLPAEVLEETGNPGVTYSAHDTGLGVAPTRLVLVGLNFIRGNQSMDTDRGRGNRWAWESFSS